MTDDEEMLAKGTFKKGTDESKSQKLVAEGKFKSHIAAYEWLGSRGKRNHARGRKRPLRRRIKCKGGPKGRKR